MLPKNSIPIVIVFFEWGCVDLYGQTLSTPLQVKEDCDSFGGTDLVFYNEEVGRCMLKIQESIKVSEKFVQNESLACPVNASFVSFGRNGRADDSNSQGYCMCPKRLVPNPDFKSCITGRLFQEPCSNATNLKCSAYAGLECSIGLRCQCKVEGAIWNRAEALCYSDTDCARRHFSAAYYDTEIGKCFLKLNGVAFCDQTEDGGNEDPTPALAPEVSTPSCPPNSHCVYSQFSSGAGMICKCRPGFGADGDENKRCVRVQLFGETCVMTNNSRGQDPCDVANGLECSNGTCACQGYRKYDARSHGCRVPVGSKCSPWGSSPDHSKCGLNGECTRRSTPSGDSAYGFNDEYKCTCAKGFVPFNGFCYANYGDMCSRGADCFQGMKCIDGICRCGNPLTQKVDSADGKRSCVNLAGTSCDIDSKLTAHAFCQNGTVSCPVDFATSRGGECLLTRGKECASNQGRCNFQDGLACVDGTCACVDGTLEYKEGIGCVASAGSICGELLSVGNCDSTDCNSRNDKYEVKCDLSASCVPVTSTTSKCIENGATL